MNVSDKIRLTREEVNLTREQVADKLGMSLSAYGNIERGVTDISMSRLEKIAKALDKTVTEIMLKGEEGIVIINGNLSHSPFKGGSVTINFYGKEYEAKMYLDGKTEI